MVQTSLVTEGWTGNWSIADFRFGKPIQTSDAMDICQFYEFSSQAFKLAGTLSSQPFAKTGLYLIGFLIAGALGNDRCKTLDIPYDRTDFQFDLARLTFSFLPTESFSLGKAISIITDQTLAYFHQAKRDFEYKISYLNENLFKATLNNEMEKVRDLCKKGAQINVRLKSIPTAHGLSIESFRYTPLGIASVKGSAEEIRTLVDLGADVHLKFGNTFEKITPIVSAIFNGNEEAFFELLKLQPDLIHTQANLQQNFLKEQNLGELSFSTWLPKRAIYSIFLSQNSPLEAKDSTQFLHYALGYKPGLSTEEALAPIRDLLAFSKEHVNTKNQEGLTPLLSLISCSSIFSDFKETLVPKTIQSNSSFANFIKKRIQERNEQNQIRIDWAKKKYTDFIIQALELLLDAGAIVHITDAKGNTPLHWAYLFHNDSKIPNRLIEAKADLNFPNKDGWTPRQIKRILSDKESTDFPHLQKYLQRLLADSLHPNIRADVSLFSLQTNIDPYLKKEIPFA